MPGPAVTLNGTSGVRCKHQRMGQPFMPRHILLVDDDELLRRSLAFNLEQAGYQASTSASAEEALMSARSFSSEGNDVGSNHQEPARLVTQIIGFPKVSQPVRYIQPGLNIGSGCPFQRGTNIIALHEQTIQPHVLIGTMKC